jgi:hypothetical protein
MEIVHRNFGEATLSNRKIHKIQLANDPFNKVKGQMDAFEYLLHGTEPWLGLRDVLYLLVKCLVDEGSDEAKEAGL